MRVRMTITAPELPVALDVTVDADPSATASDLLDALHDTCAVQGPVLSVAGVPVEPDAPLGAPPLLDGCCLRVSVAPAPPRATLSSVPLRLEVTGGPDAGLGLALSRGRHVVGRDSACDLVVNDPRMSRAHCAVTVCADGIQVGDLGSTNGTAVEGGATGEGRIVPGEELALGDTRLVIRTGASRPAARTPTGHGTIQVHRSPRVPGSAFAASFEWPRPPEPPVLPRLPWLTMLLPLPVCAVLAWFWGPQMLAFALLGPAMSGGSAIAERRAGRRRHAADLATHRARHAAVAVQVADAVHAERAGLRAGHPDAAEILRAARQPGHRLWERGPDDPPVVRLGTGRVRSAVVVVDPATHRPVAQTCDGAPVVLDLSTAGVLGVAGRHGRRTGAGRLLVGQLAALHSPHDVRVWVLDAPDMDGAAWSWTRWLPHRQGLECSAAETVDRLLATHDPTSSDEGGPRHRGHDVLVLPDAASVREVPRLGLLLDRAGRGGLAVLALAGRPEDLPAQCGAVLELGDDAGSTTLARAGEDVEPISADGAGAGWAERLARALAPLRDAGPTTQPLPSRLTLGEALGEALGRDLDDPDELRRTWDAAGDDLRATLGAAGSGPHCVDLVADGPHTLLGGTTGSGKSELLQTLVAGLAAAYPPESVSFLLIDYKGGAAFRECARLPHTVGTVTDLDPALARRALVSLTAEVKRREALLAAAGAGSLTEYRARPRAAQDPLPRLVIVIDELRMLVEELPDFVEGLVRLAAVGRSLGLHLVLATQRPAGAITADIQANVNLRIALRVRDRIDSEHVLESPAAALLPEDVPGRALMSTGSGPCVAFQAAHAGAVTSGRPTVHVEPRFRSGTAPPTIVAGGRTDLERLVDAARRATKDRDERAPAPPWLPPLPPSVGQEGLMERCSQSEVPLGLVDVPQRQAQELLRWSPAEVAVLGVVGASGCGRTTLLRTLVAGLATCPGLPPVHVYAVDAGRSLAPLEALPFVGAVVDPEDTGRLRRLLARLREEIGKRTRDLAQRGLTSLPEWRHAEPATAPAYIVLLVDGWDGLADGTGTAHDAEAFALLDELRQVVETGAAAGVRAVLTGGRALLVGRAARLCTSTVVLGSLDAAEAALVGLPRLASSEPLPGRGVRVEDGLEVQVAHCGADPAGAAQLATLAGFAGADRHRAEDEATDPHRRGPGGPGPGGRPFLVGVLPDVVDHGMLPADASLVIGVGDDGRPVGPVPDRDGRHLLVAGPRGSGRTGALAVLAARCLAARRSVVWACPAPSRILDDVPDGVLRVGPEQVDQLVRAHRADPGLVVLVDDADQLCGSPLDAALVELSAGVDRHGGLLVCSVQTSTMATLFRGSAVEVARRRAGLLLSPTGLLDGDAFGTTVPRQRGVHPGRGYLIGSGAPVPLQVARPAGPRSRAA